MKAILLQLVLLVTAISIAAAPLSNPSPLQARQAVLGATALLHIGDDGSSGSAFAVTSRRAVDGVSWVTYWITAQHCIPKTPDGAVDPAVLLSIEMAGIPIAAVVAEVHPTLDVAVVSTISAEPYFVLALADRKIVLGERAYTCGFPGGVHRYLTEGFVSGRTQASVMAFPGQSGGPVTDENGAVIGVLVQILGRRFPTMMGDGSIHFVTHAAVFVPLPDFIEWLRRSELI